MFYLFGLQFDGIITWYVFSLDKFDDLEIEPGTRSALNAGCSALVLLVLSL